MDKYGKLMQVKVKDLKEIALVYADDGNLEIIQNVVGVRRAYQNEPTKYEVFLDPRYDRATVLHNIETEILNCGE